MRRNRGPGLLLRLGAAAVVLLVMVAAAVAAPTPAHWKAVLVAGDNAEPVFDNAVAALARWLTGRGVPVAEIHRLSANPTARDATIEPASAHRVLQAIAGLAAKPGEECFVFLTSHGKRDVGFWLAYQREFLTPGELAQALAQGCGGAPTVAIVSSCYSGAFSDGAMRAPNRIVLTAARADRPSFGCEADRTFTVFDECLLSSLPHAGTWRATFERNLGCVRRRERWLNVLPSQPQAYFGTRVRSLSLR